MAVECGVIAGLFLLFVFVFLRRNRKEWAIATLPLILLPLADVVLEMAVIKMMKVEVTAFGAILTLFITVVASAAWIGVASGTIRMKQNKRTAAFFVTIANLFDIALAAILISDILSRAEKLETIISAV